MQAYGMYVDIAYIAASSSYAWFCIFSKPIIVVVLQEELRFTPALGCLVDDSSALVDNQPADLQFPHNDLPGRQISSDAHVIALPEI